MTKHVITIPWRSSVTEELVWDDEAGTVEGETAEAERVRTVLARSASLDVSDTGRILILENPAHDPRDFWRLLPPRCQEEPVRSQMPEILRNAEPTPAQAPAVPIIIDRHGVEREAIPGKEFCW